MQGFKLALKLAAKHSKEGKCTLGLNCCNITAQSDTCDRRPAVSAEFLFGAQKANIEGLYTHVLRCNYILAPDTGLGPMDLFKKGPISSINDLSELIVGGHPKLRLGLVKLDGRQLV